MPSPSGEQVVGTISRVLKPKSFGRGDSYTIVITNSRMIFAVLTAQMLNEGTKQALAQAKGEGKGFFGQWKEQLKGYYFYAQKYTTMNPDAILAENPGNFAFYNNSISEVKLKQPLAASQTEQQRYEYELEVHAGGKYEFRIPESDDNVQLLKQVYGERVKTPWGLVTKGPFKVKFGI